ncbi:hypothetical protein Dimus_035133 [Dionaea muscipula]
MAQGILQRNPRNQLGFPSSSPDHQPLTSYSSAITVATSVLSAAAGAAAKAMSNDAVLKPEASMIVDRFRDLLKEREDEFRIISGGSVVPPPNTEEIVRLYELVLSELTLNSKSIITDLTIIAREQREHGEGIAGAVCARILEVPADQKMPALYLLDSIVKKIGMEYVQYFSSCLVEVFCEACSQVPPNLYPAMRHLFGTWSAVFPSAILQKIEAELQFSPSVNSQSAASANPSDSQSSQPPHGIHVNPKSLEGKRHFDSSSLNNNIQHSRGTSTSKIYGQKSAAGEGYDVYDSDQGDGPVTMVGAGRLIGYGGRTSTAIRAENFLPSVTELTRPLSPSIDEFTASRSPGQITERVSAHCGFSYGFGRLTGRVEKPGDLSKRHGFENPSPYGLNNGNLHDGPRALINAYGQDDGQKALSGRPLRDDPLIPNGMNSKMVARPWQYSEEEEFDWEDMNPSLVDRRDDDPTTSSSTFMSRPSLDIHGRATLNPSFRSSVRLTQIPRSTSNNSVADRGSATKFSDMTNQVVDSRHPQETWNLKRKFPYHSENILPNGMIERNTQLNFAAATTSTLAGDRTSINMDHLSHPDSQLGMPTATMGAGTTGFDATNAEPRPSVLPVSTGLSSLAGLHGSHLPPYPPTYPPEKQIRVKFDFFNTNDRFINQAQQLFNVDEVNNAISVRPLNVLNPQEGLVPLHFPTQPPVPFQQQMLLASQAKQTAFSSPLAPPQMSRHGHPMVGHPKALTNTTTNPISGLRPPLPPQNIYSSSLQIHGTLPPTLHPGLPACSQSLSLPLGSGHIPQHAPGNAFSGFVSSLVAQGLISLTEHASGQDSLGVDFDQDHIKVRRESAIRALYADLPRQCRTCGLRFRSQEEHSIHMDWHVTKNRSSRNRKQNPSRKWFVSASMWLTGAEALGTAAAAAAGFMPTEAALETKYDDEIAVPADEHQSTCALCWEPFDDFYSDETEEWMYKGAVYLNAPDGSMASLDRSQLGPIVHAKCRSESGTVSPKDSGQDGEGTCEEGNQRKRMRT